MIRFFRTLRRRLLAENRLGRYLLYAMGEIMLVVIGILIALQVDQWNEERKLRTQAKEYEERLINDIITDTLSIHRSLPIRLETIENIEAYFERFETTELNLFMAIEEANKVRTGLARYVPIRYTFEDMKATGNISLLPLPKQDALLKLAYWQDVEVIIDEKLMDNFYRAAEAAEGIIERRGMIKANKESTHLRRSGLPFTSVYDKFGIPEDPERQAQGLIHRQNMLTALLNYHQVALSRNRQILELSKETIEILRTGH